MSAAPVLAYVGVGANLGNAPLTVEYAIRALGSVPHTKVVARSFLYRSAPVNATGPDFVNAVVALETSLPPFVLLADLQRLEDEAGRERPFPNAPRTLDLDILLYGQERIASPALTVPHPRMHERAFVLVPLAEIAPQLVTAAQLAAVTSQVIARMTPGADHWAIHNRRFP